jgi:PAS domain S-box-containing protein
MVEKNRLMLMVESISKSSTGVLADLTSKVAMKVLHVDDDLNYLKVAKQCLEMQGRFRVDTARSAEEAMEKMKKETYDAIISDYLLPGKNGLEFLKELRDEGNDIPFIIFTGKGREEVAIKALNLGADGYFDKHGEPETVYGELAHGIRQAAGRKKADMKIWEREERLRAVFGSSPDAITVSDLHGNILDCNEAALRMMGYSSKEEIVGKNRLELIAEKDRESALKSLKIAFEQGTIKNVEYTFLKKNGEEYQGELSASILRDSVGNPVCFVGVIRDTSERKKAEEALRESEQRFRRLSEATFEAIAIHDKGKILDANQNFAKMFGYELSEVIGKNALDFAAPESRDLVLKNILSRCEKPFEGMALRKDGSTFVQETRGKAIPYEGRIVRVTAMHDITERRTAEEALRESKERYRELAESISDVFFAMDKDFRYTYWNKASEKLTGISAKDAIGKSLTEVFPDVKGTKIEQVYLETLRTQQPQSCLNKYQLRDKGYVFEINAFPTKAGLSVFVKDITERKKVEEEKSRLLRDLNDRVKELNCLYGMSELFEKSDISLDGALQGTTDLLSHAMQYPDIACARIVVENREFSTKNFKETGWKLQADIKVHGKKAGFVEVRYLEERPTIAEGPFLKEERYLIDAIAERLGRITERKKAEGALRDANEKWASLTENTDDIVMIVDGNGVIQYINRTIPPYTPEETVGKTVYEYVPREQHNVFEKSLREVFKTGEPDSYQVSSNIPKIGTIWFSTKLVPIKHDGKVSSAILVSSNITDRKKAEEELRNSEERLSVLFELAPDAYYLNDLKGNFIDGNKAAEEVTGYMKNELIGKSFLKLKLLPRNEALKAAKLLAMNALGKPTGPDEFVLNRKDGTQVPVEIRTYPVKIKGKTLVLGIARDITIRKKDEQIVKESQQKFEGLFKHNPEAAVYLDSDFRILDANPRFCQLFGYSAEEVKGKKINDVVVPEGMREEAEGLNRDAKDGYASHNTVRKRKDGSLVPVSNSAAPVTFEDKLLGYVGIYKDITELKRAQEESEESRKHFQMLFDLMADPVAVVDGKGKILEVTQKAEEITGFKKEELVGKNLLKVKMFGAKTKAVLIKSLAKRMMGMHVEPYEVEVLKKDGGKLMYEINAAKISYKGKPADLVVFRDILERKKLEEKLRVVGGLTRHDVRNKLCAVTGNAYLLKRKLAGNPEALKQLVDMENAVRNVEAIFEFARTYEKLGVEKLVNMNVGKAVDEQRHSSQT